MIDPNDGAISVQDASDFRQFTSFDGLVKHADSFMLDEVIECGLILLRSAPRRVMLRDLIAWIGELMTTG